MRLAVVAIILASCALVISILQPSYNFFTDPNNQVPGQPAINLQSLYLGQFDTHAVLVNNGTATAHNVKLNFAFSGPNTLAYDRFIGDLPNTGEYTRVTFPIGEFQLQYLGWNTTQYILNLQISYDELGQPASLKYNARPGYIVLSPSTPISSD
jgi:hypothetical protein